MLGPKIPTTLSVGLNQNIILKPQPTTKHILNQDC